MALAGQTCRPEAAKPINIMFFQPEEQRSEFWFNSKRFAQAVANDLGVSLHIVEITDEARNRFTFKQLTSQSLQTNPRPDFILSIFYGGGEYKQLDVFNQTGIPFFTFNTSLDDKVLAITKSPRERFENWRGHRSPNEVLAGAVLTSKLSAYADGKAFAILGGPTASRVNAHRVDGATRRGIREQMNVIPAVTTDWKQPSSAKATKMLLNRIPEIDIIWTAGPDIALGAIAALKGTDANADKVAIGTFDWTLSNLELIGTGDLDVALGGHFMDAGWSIVTIYDYLHGKDFDDDPGTLVLSELVAIDATNAARVKPWISEAKWESIDFRHYSKCLNPALETYDFTLPTNN